MKCLRSEDCLLISAKQNTPFQGTKRKRNRLWYFLRMNVITAHSHFRVFFIVLEVTAFLGDASCTCLFCAHTLPTTFFPPSFKACVPMSISGGCTDARLLLAVSLSAGYLPCTTLSPCDLARLHILPPKPEQFLLLPLLCGVLCLPSSPVWELECCFTNAARKGVRSCF